MRTFRIVNFYGTGKFYTGLTESSKIAKEESKTIQGEQVHVYKFETAKVNVDLQTFINALNQEEWCEPELMATFVNGKATFTKE